MRIVYTNENRKLKVLSELINSSEFISFLKERLRYMQKYFYGSKRMESDLVRRELNQFLKSHDLYISEKVDHANGIGNNNAYYVQDCSTKEYVGCMNLNTDMYGGLYCYASDINNNKVSNTYFLRDTLVQTRQTFLPDWERYSFMKELKMLDAIEEAISLGVLQEGENGGVLISHIFHGYEAWEEDIKEDAAKKLVESGQEQLLLTAIEEKKAQIKKCEEIFERYRKSYVQEYSDGYITGLEQVEDRIIVRFQDEDSDRSWSHIVFVDENNELQIKTEFGISIYDYAKEYGWSENDIYKMKHGHVPYQECKKGVLLEYKGIVFDEWTIDQETGDLWGEMCECCVEKYKDLLMDELDDGGIGSCSVKGCSNVGADMDTEKHYYVDFKPELVKFVEVLEKDLEEEKGVTEVESKGLDELLEGVKGRLGQFDKDKVIKEKERE